MTTIQIQLKGSNLLMGWQRLKISLQVSDTLFCALLSFVLCDRYGEWPTKISARSDCFLRSYFECIWCVLSTGCSPHTNPSKTKQSVTALLKLRVISCATIRSQASVDHLPHRFAWLQYHRNDHHTILKLLICGMYYLDNVGISRENPRGFSISE